MVTSHRFGLFGVLTTPDLFAPRDPSSVGLGSSVAHRPKATATQHRPSSTIWTQHFCVQIRMGSSISTRDQSFLRPPGTSPGQSGPGWEREPDSQHTPKSMKNHRFGHAIHFGSVDVCEFPGNIMRNALAMNSNPNLRSGGWPCLLETVLLFIMGRVFPRVSPCSNIGTQVRSLPPNPRSKLRTPFGTFTTNK